MLIQPTAACHTKPDCATQLQQSAQDHLHLLCNNWDKVGVQAQKRDPSKSTFLDRIRHNGPKRLGPFSKVTPKIKNKNKQPSFDLI